MSGFRQIYWINSQPSAALSEKVELLKRYQIEVKILPDFPSLMSAYAENRLNTIIISDNINDRRLQQNLQKICVRPEYAGVRFFLSLSQHDPDLLRHVIALGFRDVIALDLPSETWIRRYNFASAGQSTNLSGPMPQIAVRNIAAVHVPARITWMSDNELWLETRLIPPIGSQISVSGGLASILGVHHVSVVVLEHHKTHLHYRYSDALLCRWDIPKHAYDRKQALAKFLLEQKDNVPYRIYNIVRTPALRKELVKQLDPRHFHLSLALNKTNMIHEPRYISPDAIVVEDQMCMGSHRVDFKEMLDQVEPSVPIIIVGNKGSADKFQDISRTRQIIRISSLPPSFGSYLADKIGEPKKPREGAIFVPKHHRLSFAQIIVSARLTRAHPDIVQVALHYPLGRFGICALESALFNQGIGRKVYMKVVTVSDYEDPHLTDFPHQVEGLLIDIQNAERPKLIAALVQYLQEHLNAPMLKRTRPTPPRADSLPPPEQNEELTALPSLAPEIEVISAQDSLPVAQVASIAIEPRVEELYAKTNIDRAVDGISKIGLLFNREMKIVVLTLIIFGLFFALIRFYSPPESQQANIYTDQLRIFRDMHARPKRDGNDQP